MIKELWENGEVPNDWKTAIICPILKKGDLMEITNYRGISFLDTCYKVLSIAILQRLEVYANDIIGDHQSGFMRVLLEKYYEYDRKVHLCLVDSKQAYEQNYQRKIMGSAVRIWHTNQISQADMSAVPKSKICK